MQANGLIVGFVKDQYAWEDENVNKQEYYI